jgi:hypothetical protein
MNKSVTLLTLVVVACLPASIFAADAQSVIDKVLELQEERRAGVNRYVVEQKIMGQVSKVVFERTTVTGPDGEPVETFGVVLPDDFAAPEGDSVITKDDFDDMAENGVHTIADFSDNAQLVGTESIDGKETYHLVATDLDRTQEYSQGNSFTLQTVNVWVDSDKYVPLKMTMDGIMTTDGAPRPVTMEKLDQDYRDVPGSNMYESYKQIMLMNGVMSDAEREQMEQAREQLAEFEQQLLEMPQSQRDMMMNMMGEQIEMMRKLAAGDGLEIITEVLSITVE